MIDTAAVRTKILLLAMEGKLSEQKETDGVAIPSDKVVSDSSKDANAYKIPRSWKWVRVKDVVAKDVGGGTPSKAIPEYWENGEIPWVTVKDFSNAKSGYINETIDHITTEGLENSASNMVDEEAIVVCMRMALGKIVRLAKPMAINQDLRALWLESFVLPDYFVYFYKTLKVKGRGTTVSGIRKGELMNYAFPVPPIEEQKRIVSKVDDIYELLDTIDIFQTQYASNVEVLKNKLIDAAICGKLTGQLPEDGDAEDLYNQIQDEKAKLIKEGRIKKEKSLGDITEDEIPFEIPKNWKWVRLRGICTKIVDGDHNPPKGEQVKTEYLMLSAQNINDNRLVDMDNVRYLSKEVYMEENKRTNLQVDDILLTIVGTMGRSCVYRGGLNACFQRSVAVISTLAESQYIKNVFDTSYIQKYMVANATGAAQLGFYLNKVDSLLIPLPPLPEQKRIVEKLETLLGQL